MNTKRLNQYLLAVLCITSIFCIHSVVADDYGGDQKWFKVRRAEHLSAVKHILQSDYAKQYSMLKSLFTTMIKTLTTQQSLLSTTQFIPGHSDFPADQTIREHVSLVLENGALFCDVALRLPDITKQILAKNQNLHQVVHWAVQFGIESGFYDEITRLAANLASQELGWIEKQSDFHNPYANHQSDSNEQTKMKTKKKKETTKKGPKLSRRKTEL